VTEKYISVTFSYSLHEKIVNSAYYIIFEFFL